MTTSEICAGEMRIASRLTGRQAGMSYERTNELPTGLIGLLFTHRALSRVHNCKEVVGGH